MAPAEAGRMRRGALVPLTILLLFIVVAGSVSQDFQPLHLSRTNRLAPTALRGSVLGMRLRGGLGRPKKADSDDDDEDDDDVR